MRIMPWDLPLLTYDELRQCEATIIDLRKKANAPVAEE